MLGAASDAACEVAVVEFADGVLQRETAALLPSGASSIHRLDVRDRAAWDEALAAFAKAAGISRRPSSRTFSLALVSAKDAAGLALDQVPTFP